MNIRYERQLKKGILEILVLKLISVEPKYGYQLIKELDERSDGIFKIKEGTLYPILYRLEDDHLIRSEWSEAKEKSISKKYYIISNEGIKALEDLISLWEKFSYISNQILED